MSIILVPVINQYPDKIAVNFQTEYAVPMEVANPYLNTAGLTAGSTPSLASAVAACQPGGAGVLGGPEYVNLLERTSPSTVQSNGFGYEQFELSTYPGYTFFSFNNFVTGVKTVVAFDQSVAQMPIASPTTLASYVHATAGATASYPDQASGATGAVTYTWGGTIIGTGITGQGTNSINFAVTGVTGPATLTVTITEGGSSITATKTITVT